MKIELILGSYHNNKMFGFFKSQTITWNNSSKHAVQH